MFLDCGADPNEKDECGQTPLHNAARDGRAEIVRALLEGGADPNAEDEDGETPLRIAAEEGHTEITQALLDAVANAEVGQM